MAFCLLAAALAVVGAGRPARGQQSHSPGSKPARDIADIRPETPPFDRLILRDGSVVDCHPLKPRPLGEMARDAEIELRLIESGAQKYKLAWKNVERVIYFEDMLLEAADRLLQGRQFNDAFDYLAAVRRLEAGWPGLEERFDRLLFEEASDEIGQGRPERALNLLTELKGRNGDYPKLASLYGRGIDQLVDRAFRASKYWEGRRLLYRLSQEFPEHPVAQQWRERYAQRADELIDQAFAREQAGQWPEASRLVQQAAEVWPESPRLKEALSGIFPKHRFLVVGVNELPGSLAQWSAGYNGAGFEAGSADERAARLLYLPLMEPPPLPESEPYVGRLAESFEKADLGLRVDLRLHGDFRWSDGRSGITALDVAQALTARADPAHPDYDPQWAGVFRGLRSDSLFELSLDFAQPLLRPEAFFLRPILPLHRQRGRAGAAGELRKTAADVSRLAGRAVPSAPDVANVVGNGPYVLSGAGPAEVVYRVNPHYPTRPQIDELIERRYVSSRDALRALVLGQVAMVEHVAPFDLEKVRARQELRIGQFAVPRVHFLSFDLRRPELRERTLRRALVYAIDRATILHQHLLAGAPTEGDAVLSGPFRRESYAYDSAIEPRPYDPQLARVLLYVARRQLGGALPAMKLYHPPSDVARVACQQIARYLKQAGLEIELVEVDDQALKQALAGDEPLDLVYRITTTREPLVEAARLFSLVPGAEAGQQTAGAGLRQLLARLGQATDWPTARATLKDIHRTVHDEVAIVPLWQLTDYFVFHQRLRAVQSNPWDLYENVDQWQMEPWIVKDAFSSN